MGGKPIGFPPMGPPFQEDALRVGARETRPFAPLFSNCYTSDIFPIILVDIAQQKRELREAIRTRLAGFSAKERAVESRTLCKTLQKILPEDLQEIAAFFPLPDEVDIAPFLAQCLEKGTQVFLPRFESGEMIFREVKSLSHLKPGPLNVPEPPLDAALLDPQNLSHVLVPGRAFDRKGNRLGRGNGGDDKWMIEQRKVSFDKLRMTSKTVFWGVCFECQVVQEVPVEGHDAKVDEIVTARGLVGN